MSKKSDNNNNQDARAKALEATLADLTKRYGENAVMRLGDADNILNVDVISTGSLAVDLALGIGGLPRGRVTEIYGPESSGKTTLCLSVIAQAQKMGGVCAFVDMEHALDPRYAERLGVDIDNLYISQPDMAEQALEIVEALVRSGAVDVVVLDSVAALVPRAEIEGEMGDAHVGLQARLMSQALRKISGAIKQTNTMMIFTNQLREKIGVMFGNPETTSGGRALKFYASVRLDIRRIQAIKKGADIVGNRTRVKVTKNKVAPPFQQAEFDIMYNEGFSHAGDVIDLGTEFGIIEKRGAFYRYNDGIIGQGRENAKQYLSENPELLYEIDMLIRQQVGVSISMSSKEYDEEFVEEE
ncbi:MAG: recombinase RecA [Chloroflexi bacterium]|nr:recombinase RecA [Chloroflexota bacterium]